MTRQNPLGVERGQGAGLWSAFGVALAVVVAYGVSLWILPEQGPALVWFVGARLLVEATACALVVVRVVRIPRERAAWTVMAAALGILVAGDAVQSLAPISASTLRWLAPAINLVFFLGLIGCLGVLVRDRFARLSLSMLLDALISTLGLLCVVFFLTSLVGVGEQATLLSLAYLIPSLLYVSVLVALLSGLNRRPSAAWWLNLGAALLLFLGSLAVGPALALGQTRTPSPVDALWPAAALLLALVAWCAPASRTAPSNGLRVVVYVPAIFSTGALVILVFNELDTGGGAIEFLAFATLASGIARLLVSVIEAERLRQRERELSVSLERARDAALAATSAKSTFLATMSHEMRTPLNAILGMNELLAGTDLDPVQRDYADRASASGSLLLDVVTDILDFSKIEAGAIDLVRAPFDLRRLVTSTVTVLSFAAESKGLIVVADYAPDVPTHVMGDATRLRQVLVNLLGNAVKFTAQGEVRVSVRRGAGPDAVRFEVADTGIGIPADALQRIFEPFTQADDSTTRTHGGTGLGLSICDALVRMMGGRIRVNSDVGRGSTFTFDIALEATAPPAESPRAVVRVGRHPASAVPTPAAAPTALREGVVPAPTEPTASVDLSAHEPLNVLVAEDNPTLQLLSSQILGRLGHRATVVSNGEEAVVAVGRDAYDIVLMDVHMPVTDGLEATRRIRAAGDTVAQPYIIALTAGATEQDREDCLRAGMDGYVTKPFTMKDLRRAFETAELHAPPDDAGPTAMSPHRFTLLNDLGPEVKADVLRTFVLRSGDDVSAIADAVRRGAAEDARALAHRLRGASLALGAALLAEACARIERGSDEQALDPRRVAAVRDAAAIVVDDAERELRALSSG
ncbi:ATP-binding protein [Microbacterium sp. RURRCA19A]|uniref:ATP-binding protein n=1 Tax=Microbacterium sp. RURRCA19A TaxID=1907391 RepID=UPI000954934C|nr:ATP-binding protein [Microbacterium sp. RURRCA19A]SIR74452.1 Signal transduction histidine kinase [Microbacterium sp. RURRCA19A]